MPTTDSTNEAVDSIDAAVDEEPLNGPLLAAVEHLYALGWNETVEITDGDVLVEADVLLPVRRLVTGEDLSVLRRQGTSLVVGGRVIRVVPEDLASGRFNLRVKPVPPACDPARDAA